MIITSPVPLDVNKTYTYEDLNMPFMYDGNPVYEYAFLVVRESTMLEFRKYLMKTFGIEREQEVINYDYFYEVQTD